MQKRGANPYQITGVGTSLYETIDLKINKGLYVYTGFLMQHTLSRKLRSLDKISGKISEERFSSLTFAATYIGVQFLFGWRKGTLLSDVTQKPNFAIHSGWLKPNRYELQNAARLSNSN